MLLKITSHPSYYIRQLRCGLYFLFRLKLALPFYKKRILLIKNDSIGDYIIFRNFLEEIRKSEKFSGYELYFITNPKIQAIVQQLDGNLLKEIIPFAADYAQTISGELKLYKKLNAYRFQYIINPSFSPTSQAQHLNKYLAAQQKIAVDADTSNQTLADKLKYEPYYTQLIKVNVQGHEFEKLKSFFSQVLQKSIQLQKPVLTIKEQNKTGTLVICPGAQHPNRIWPTQHYAALVNYFLTKNARSEITVVTGPGEEELYHEIAAQSRQEPKHYKIKDILSLAQLISSSSLVVCNDSSAAHIAVACGTQNVCITNGNHFSRFIPYPNTVETKQVVVMHPQLIKDVERGTAVENYYNGSQLNIADISVEEVIKACEIFDWNKI